MSSESVVHVLHRRRSCLRVCTAICKCTVCQDLRTNAFHINTLKSIERGLIDHMRKVEQRMRSPAQGSQSQKLQLDKVFTVLRGISAKVASLNVGQFPFGLAIGICLKDGAC
jgi:hypothetical protein